MDHSMHQKKVFVDVDKKQIAKLSLGDSVEIVTKGTVCELRDREEYEAMPCGCMGDMKKDKKAKKEMKAMPSSVGVKVASVKVNGKNAYEELDKDED